MNSEMDDWLSVFYELNPEASQYIEKGKIPKKENTLPLGLELSAMDLCDRNFYTNLSDIHKKEISLWVLMRYMSSSRSKADDHLLMVNDIVNVNFNVISKHPELQWKLLTVCGSNKQQFHQWIPPGQKTRKNKLEEILLSLNPLMKDDELELLQKINTQSDFEQYLKDNAFNDKEIKDLFKGMAKGA